MQSLQKKKLSVQNLKDWKHIVETECVQIRDNLPSTAS